MDFLVRSLLLKVVLRMTEHNIVATFSPIVHPIPTLDTLLEQSQECANFADCALFAFHLIQS